MEEILEGDRTFATNMSDKEPTEMVTVVIKAKAMQGSHAATATDQ